MAQYIKELGYEQKKDRDKKQNVLLKHFLEKSDQLHDYLAQQQEEVERARKQIREKRCLSNLIPVSQYTYSKLSGSQTNYAKYMHNNSIRGLLKIK